MTQSLFQALREGETFSGTATVQDMLLRAATSWRSFVRANGDNYLAAIDAVVRAADKIPASDNEIEHGRAVSDLKDALANVQAVTNTAYNSFKDGRDALYGAASAWGLSTTRKGTSPKKSAPITDDTEEALIAAINKTAGAFREKMRDVLNQGAGAVKDLLAMAKTDNPADHTKLLNTGLDFRDAVSAVFALTNGILRRADELSRRSWDRKTFESAEIRAPWTAPWREDRELGEGEYPWNLMSPM